MNVKVAGRWEDIQIKKEWVERLLERHGVRSTKIELREKSAKLPNGQSALGTFNVFTNTISIYVGTIAENSGSVELFHEECASTLAHEIGHAIYSKWTFTIFLLVLGLTLVSEHFMFALRMPWASLLIRDFTSMTILLPQTILYAYFSEKAARNFLKKRITQDGTLKEWKAAFRIESGDPSPFVQGL